MKIGPSVLASDGSPQADEWLSAELNRIWLLAELCLRQFQRAQLRPQADHPSMAEIEVIFSARRQRRGKGAGPVDIKELAGALKECDEKILELRKQAPIGRLMTSLDLRPQELETLVIVSAPHIDAPLADVFQVLYGPRLRRGVDLALISQFYQLSRSERMRLLDAMDPDRPLLFWRLVQIMPLEMPEAYGSMFYRAIQPTYELLSALCGRNELSPPLKTYAELRQGQATLDDLALDAPMRARLERLCQEAQRSGQVGAGGQKSRMPWMLLWGPRGAGKTEVAARLAAFAGRPLLVFKPSLVEANTFDDVLRRVQREALLRGAFLYVGPLTPALMADQGRSLMRRFNNYTDTVVFGVEAMEPPRFHSHHMLQEVEIKIPAESTRLELWERMVPRESRGRDVKLPVLARAFNLTPGEITETALEARAIAELSQNGKTLQEVLRSGIDRRLRNELGELARRIVSKASWDDLILPPADMFRVREFINRNLFGHRVYGEWGFGDRIGYGRGTIALFSGPPGTGKTMLARLVAQALDLDLYQVDLAQVVSKWVGETEKQLAKVFDQAERAHAVLLFDEADALFAKRTEVKSSNDRFGNMAVNYLLQRLEQYSGVAVLTTNKADSLDEGLARRLSLHLHFEIPEPTERERLWRSMFPARVPCADDINFVELAREFELSGGYIKNVVLRAAFMAAADGIAIHMELLRRAAALEMEDMGKLVHRDYEELLDSEVVDPSLAQPQHVWSPELLPEGQT